MKKLIISCLLLQTNVCFAALISHTDYTDGSVITAAGQISNENKIFNDYNGNIDNNNIKAGGVVDSNIAVGTIDPTRLNSVLQSSFTNAAYVNTPNTFVQPQTFSSATVMNAPATFTSSVTVSTSLVVTGQLSWGST